MSESLQNIAHPTHLELVFLGLSFQDISIYLFILVSLNVTGSINQ